MERTLQYYMLSYLAVFRLGRQLGAFKRKRKTPLDYSEERNSHNKGELAIAKLVKDIIEHIASQHPTFFITNNLHAYSGSQMYLSFTIETRNLLSTYSPLLHERSLIINKYITTEEERQTITQALGLREIIYTFQQSSQVGFSRWSAVSYWNRVSDINMPGTNVRIKYSNAHIEAFKFIKFVKVLTDYTELMIKFKLIEDRCKAEDVAVELAKAEEKKNKSKSQKCKDVEDLTNNLRTLLRMDASGGIRNQLVEPVPLDSIGPDYMNTPFTIVVPPGNYVEETIAVPAVPLTPQQRFDEALRRRRGEV